MKILPKSHLKIKEYSKEVSKHILMKPNNQFFPQASEVFQEIVPQNNYVSLKLKKAQLSLLILILFTQQQNVYLTKI